jgi:hypothetical protein
MVQVTALFKALLISQQLYLLSEHLHVIIDHYHLALWKLHQLKSTRGYNRILSVQVDQDKRIHIDYMSGSGYH